MRTTLDIEDDVLATAKQLAQAGETKSAGVGDQRADRSAV